MIHYLVTPRFHDPLTNFLAGRGAELAPLVRVVAYPSDPPGRRDWQPLRRHSRSWRRHVEKAHDWLAGLRRQHPRPGVFIFADLERLTPGELERAAALWEALVRDGLGRRMLNHPLRVLRRYALLRALKEQGLNDFDVYRLAESRQPTRYPVFLRRENEHGGDESDLLYTPAELEAALAELDGSGRSRELRMLTEFRAECDDRKLYRKYSAWHVGGRIFPGHLYFGPHWMLKEPVVVDEELAEIEAAYLDENPHADVLRRAFAIGQIDYGRADYGLVDGRVQIYEINTNPGLTSGLTRRRPTPRDAADRRCASQLIEALRALDASVS